MGSENPARIEDNEDPTAASMWDTITRDLEEIRNRYACAVCVEIMPESVLHPAKLYLGDNGRCFCGKLHCAGITAYASGCDLSGQEVEEIPAKYAGKMRCETCKFSPQG